MKGYPPMSLLVNRTMREAATLQDLGRVVFDTDDGLVADRAITALVALGSVARRTEGEPGLLPCRIHSFFRGLPGLWACVDSSCAKPGHVLGPGPIGRLYAQPRDTCE